VAQSAGTVKIVVADIYALAFTATVTTARHPRDVAGALAIRELRWLRRYAPESRKHCDDLEAAIRREMRRGRDRELRAARLAKEAEHNAQAIPA
jgi:uncharacterized protein YaeQ